ncbi:sialate O-acetylesterase [soil metagenome]
MKMKSFGPLMLKLGLLWPGLLCAQLEVAGIFTDHMVLQRDQPIAIWGTAAPSSEVAVSLGEKKVTAKVDEAGHWKAVLEARPASGPFELKVDSGSEHTALKDVMIGDVWLISGQSNMVLALQSTTEWPELKKAGDIPAIRICKLPGDYAFDPADKYSRPLRWEVLNSAKAGYFSGVGYSFARALQPAIGVTLGVIQGSAGGTQAEQWTPEAQLKAALPDNPLFAVRDKARAKVEAAKAQAAAKPASEAKTPAEPALTGEAEPQAEATPTAKAPVAKVGVMESGATSMYNGTIHPLRLLKLTGVLWYQGEANSRSPRDYRPVLTTMIKAWREVFAEPKLPFVIVQLPNFGLPKDDGWMRVQEAQRLVAHDLGLGLVVTIDQGSPTTIHPPNKVEVGRRAAIAALQNVYKKDVEGTAPRPKEVKFQGDTAVVEFDGFKGNLVLKGDAVKGFELAGADQKFVPAVATIEGRSVKVKADGVPEPKAIRYLWANSPEAVTVFSDAGLPAVPFRTNKEGKVY